MLYHMESSPETLPYHNVDSWHIRAPFDTSALREAAQRIVDRHPILRTSFDSASFSERLQLVHEVAALPLPIRDIRQLTATEQERVIARVVRRESRRPFDLATPPLIRLQVHRRSDATFQLTLTECHAVLDGWSLTSTLAEFFRIYLALVRRERPPVEPPPRATYRDFIALERQVMGSDAAQRFWRAQLAGSSKAALPHLLRGHPGRPASPGFRTLELLVPAEVCEGLERAAIAVAVPFKSVLLAAHMRVMSLLIGQRDVMSGLTSNGRLETDEGEQVRGLFLNTLPFRMRMPRPAAGSTWSARLSRPSASCSRTADSHCHRC